MQTIIVEGIATSGKSSLIRQLKAKLADKLDICVADESETHIPIMKESDQLHIGFYEELIDRLVRDSPDLLILDRLYLTQAFRAKSSLAAYADIEDRLSSVNAMTIFLKIEPAKIEERIQKAVAHREPEWGEYVSTKGNTASQQAEYYKAQQEAQLGLLRRSALPYKIFDSTTNNYTRIADDIIGLLGLN